MKLFKTMSEWCERETGVVTFELWIMILDVHVHDHDHTGFVKFVMVIE